MHRKCQQLKLHQKKKKKNQANKRNNQLTYPITTDNKEVEKVHEITYPLLAQISVKTVRTEPELMPMDT